jgi:hypothetical protein
MEEIILNYINYTENAYHQLLIGYEDYISDLPNWTFGPKLITYALYDDIEFNNKWILIKTQKDTSLSKTTIKRHDRIKSSEEYMRFFNAESGEGVLRYRGRLKGPVYIEAGAMDYVSVEDGKPKITKHLSTGDKIMITLNNRFLKERLTEKHAKEKALNMWLMVTGKEPAEDYKAVPPIYVLYVKDTFNTFEAMLNKPSTFYERSLHRYINAHRNLLLPHHVKCYFEHRLYVDSNTDKDYKDADFILEREDFLSPLFIELENSKHTVVKSNGDLSYQTNHANGQISEWMKYVLTFPCNCQGEMSFLRNQPEGLTIIGRGITHNTFNTLAIVERTKVWTYDMLVENCKKNVTSKINVERKRLGLEEISLWV